MAKIGRPSNGRPSRQEKPGVVFIDESGEVKDVITQLARSALKESGKSVRKVIKENVPKRTGRFKNHIATWAYIDRKTGRPTLMVGFLGWQAVKKKGKKPSRLSPYWLEFGTKNHEVTLKKSTAKTLGYEENYFGQKVMVDGRPAQHVLRNTVNDNIDAIRAVQDKYLKEINKTLKEAGVLAYKDTSEEVESD